MSCLGVCRYLHLYFIQFHTYRKPPALIIMLHAMLVYPNSKIVQLAIWLHHTNIICGCFGCAGSMLLLRPRLLGLARLEEGLVKPERWLS